MAASDSGDGSSPNPPENIVWQGLSRRDVLKRAAVLGIAGAFPAGVVSEAASAAPEPEQLKSFTVVEAATVGAIVARLIPSDDLGPGAKEARVDRYIDRLLASPHNTYRGQNNPNSDLTDAYKNGLAAIDAYSQDTHGSPFSGLSQEKQDAVLTAMQANSATGFKPNSRTFFNLIRAHAMEGMFGDPYYGGNANFAGWDLLGFPGIRLAVTEEEQKLDVTIKSVDKSTMDYAFFNGNRRGM